MAVTLMKTQSQQGGLASSGAGSKQDATNAEFTVYDKVRTGRGCWAKHSPVVQLLTAHVPKGDEWPAHGVHQDASDCYDISR